MRLPNSEARAFVFGPLELAELLAAQFEALGIRAESVPTPQSEEELYSWLSAHRSGSDPEDEDSPGTSTFLHPGLSFWADRPEFPQIVSSVGFFPVCPSARTLSLCLNKLNLLVEAETAGIPHLALALDPLTSLREIEAALEKAAERYPVVLKSLKVAQGHGLQLIHDEKELHEIVPIWFEQLTRRYAEASILIERYLPSARHLIVPFAADGESSLEVLPPIDASLQTRWQRLIQFVPATDLDPIAEKEIEANVRKWVRHSGFSGFGSMEFLVDGDRVYLIDAVARLNAAFPLWEELLGMRTVEWQLAGLGQLPWPSSRIRDRRSWPYGAGISLRFYAEDPVRQIPCPGSIREIDAPFRRKNNETSVTWMTRFRPGEEIEWTATGVIGELFVLAQDRSSALEAGREALRELWVAGSLRTNQRFLLEHLEHPFVKENLIHAGFTDEDFVPEAFPSIEVAGEIVALAEALFPTPGARWAVGTRWVEAAQEFKTTASEVALRAGRFASNGGEGASGVVDRGGVAVRFLFEPAAGDRWLVTYATWVLALRRAIPGMAAKQASGKPKTRKILALAPGRVHALLRHPGEILQPHDRACMIESLGVLVPHAVPISARLVEWKVAPGEIVEAGRELAVLELLG